MMRNVERAQLGIVFILASFYFLQAATPLRLHPDAVVLLSVAETVDHGGGYLYHGRTTVFPPGYPSLLALLIRLHLAHVWVIVSLNVLFVLIGLLVCGHLFQRMGFSRSFVLGVCVLSLLSFVFVKYSAIPLTDMLFFCVSMLALASMNKLAASQFSWGRIIVSLALVIAAVCVRRIGVALIPALLHMLVLQSDVRL